MKRRRKSRSCGLSPDAASVASLPASVSAISLRLRAKKRSVYRRLLTRSNAKDLTHAKIDLLCVFSELYNGISSGRRYYTSNDKREVVQVIFCKVRPQKDPPAFGREQIALEKRIVVEDDLSFDPITFEGLKYIGGADISFVRDDSVNACAALVILSYPDLEVREHC